MAERIVIALDGPAGAGKSSVAKLVAKKLGITYLDTGMMYRAITCYFLNSKIDLSNLEIVRQALASLQMDIHGDHININGTDVTTLIRTPDVTALVSQVSAIKEVRIKCVEEQRRIATGTSIIMDGRDIGSVVLPHAKLKIYLDASIEERARRRMNEEGIPKSALAEMIEKIRTRDEQDRTRKESPLTHVSDAIIIDSTSISRDEVVNLICSYANKTDKTIEENAS